MMVICDYCSVISSRRFLPSQSLTLAERHMLWFSISPDVRYVPLWSAAACPTESGLPPLSSAEAFIAPPSPFGATHSAGFLAQTLSSPIDTKALRSCSPSRFLTASPISLSEHAPTSRGGKQRRQACLAAGRPPHSTRGLPPLSAGAYTRAKSCPSGHTLQRTASSEVEPIW